MMEGKFNNNLPDNDPFSYIVLYFKHSTLYVFVRHSGTSNCGDSTPDLSVRAGYCAKTHSVCVCHLCTRYIRKTITGSRDTTLRDIFIPVYIHILYVYIYTSVYIIYIYRERDRLIGYDDGMWK